MTDEDLAVKRARQHAEGVQKLTAAFGTKIVGNDGVLHDAAEVQARAAGYDRQIAAAEAIGDRTLAGRLKIAKAHFAVLPDPPQPEADSPAHRIAEDHAVPADYRHLLINTDDPDELRRRVGALAKIGAATASTRRRNP